jgi:hypothetical protein
VDEARELVAYNERIVETSGSRQRRMRAARMLVNVRPHLERLEAEEAARVARIAKSMPPAGSFDGVLQRFREAGAEARDLEVVWDGTKGRAGASLTSGLFRTGQRGT